jgi:putative transposase
MTSISVSYRASHAHCVGEANYHLQLTPKYRRTIFSNLQVKKACEASLRGIARRLNIELAAIEFGPDHAHLFVCNCRRYSVSQLAHRLKGASSRELRLKCAEQLKGFRMGSSFWSDGYFFESIGRVTSETVRYYIERQQKKHWCGDDYNLRRQREKQSSLDAWS